jgi:hypothetical protein
MTMNRPAWLRMSLLAALILPAAIVFGVAFEAQAQMEFERTWRCSKCGGNLGNGVQAPPSCPHCGVKLIGGRDNNWYGPNQNRKPSGAGKTDNQSSPLATTAVIVVVILAVLGLGVVVMNGMGSGT